MPNMPWNKIDNEDRKTWPIAFEDLIFTDGKCVYFGWIENCQPEEALSFYDVIEKDWPENITHWMTKPLPPLDPILSPDWIVNLQEKYEN